MHGNLHKQSRYLVGANQIRKRHLASTKTILKWLILPSTVIFASLLCFSFSSICITIMLTNPQRKKKDRKKHLKSMQKENEKSDYTGNKWTLSQVNAQAWLLKSGSFNKKSNSNSKTYISFLFCRLYVFNSYFPSITSLFCIIVTPL